MKLISNFKNLVKPETHPAPPKPEGPAPLVPHLRAQVPNVIFSEEDLETLTRVYGDRDSAGAAVGILNQAPPEMKIVAMQLIKLIQEVE